MSEPTAAARPPLYLEDLAVGQKYVSRPYLMTREEMLKFAAAYDPQPFHLDDQSAATSLFGSLAASGWHTAAVSMRLLVEGGPPFAGGLIGTGGEIRWPAPTRPGDSLEVHAEITEVTPSKTRPDRGTVVVRSETRNQRGEVVQLFVGRLLVPRKTSGS